MTLRKVMVYILLFIVTFCPKVNIKFAFLQMETKVWLVLIEAGSLELDSSKTGIHSPESLTRVTHQSRSVQGII